MYSTLSYYVTIGQRWPNSIGLCPFLIGKPSVIRAGLHFPILPLAPGSPKKQALQIIYHPSSLTFSLLREKASTEQPLSLPYPAPLGSRCRPFVSEIKPCCAKCFRKGMFLEGNRVRILCKVMILGRCLVIATATWITKNL